MEMPFDPYVTVVYRDQTAGMYIVCFLYRNDIINLKVNSVNIGCTGGCIVFTSSIIESLPIIKIHNPVMQGQTWHRGQKPSPWRKWLLSENLTR